MEHIIQATTTAVPANGFVVIVITLLFVYYMFWNFMLILMIMDIWLGWLRQFRWFPGEGKRVKALMHWAIALIMVLIFYFVSYFTGGIKVITE